MSPGHAAVRAMTHFCADVVVAFVPVLCKHGVTLPEQVKLVGRESTAVLGGCHVETVEWCRKEEGRIHKAQLRSQCLRRKWSACRISRRVGRGR